MKTLIIKNIGYYLLLILTVVIILPLLIVKGHNFNAAGNGTGNVVNESVKGDKGNNGGNNGSSIAGENAASGETGITDDTGVGNDKGNEETRENKNNITIRVLVKPENKVKEMDLEEYITGVVAAEMPAEFALEALKAQAVAARTYAYGRLKGLYKNIDNAHEDADVCTDFTHCQAWISKDEAMKQWDVANAGVYWDKIRKAVEETKGIILIYNGLVANPVFHSNSGGKTENAEEVWSVSPVDYLQSVVSEGEDSSPVFKTVVKISPEEFYNTLKEKYPDIKLDKNNILGETTILEYTEGGRVKRMKIGNKEIKGTEFRELFSLRSANFEMGKDKDGMIVITTYGNGHGVGMSQWGANNLAKNGKSWEEIVKYYYTGIEIGTVKP
ncbi:MAG: stage II sporulation protein D [Clostridiaceae bacterium]|nr:stage II sporulation protein D [Clostridiaceae bacterium]